MGAMGMVAGAVAARPALLHALPAQTGRVAIGMCAEYDRKVADVLSKMFFQLGGLNRLVNNKTVAIKLNMTGPPTGMTLNNLPLGMAQWVHPQGDWSADYAA